MVWVYIERMKPGTSAHTECKYLPCCTLNKGLQYEHHQIIEISAQNSRDITQPEALRTKACIPQGSLLDSWSLTTTIPVMKLPPISQCEDDYLFIHHYLFIQHLFTTPTMFPKRGKVAYKNKCLWHLKKLKDKTKGQAREKTSEGKKCTIPQLKYA